MKKTDTTLVPDIKPAPIKERSSLGVVELVLDEGQTLKAHGVVYGVEHQISGDGFEATLFLDQYSQRIKIKNHQAADAEGFERMVLKIRWIAGANGFDKITCMASRGDWQKFLGHGYMLEALVKYYHNGEDAFVVSEFRSQERLTSNCLMDETLLIEKIVSQPIPEKDRAAPEGYEFRLARREDIPGLISLYQDVFETYPSPLIYETYLETVFQSQSLYAVCTDPEGKIVAAASGELYPKHQSSELTDCATLKSARGKSLMRHLLVLLEKELAQKGYICAYTTARARSFGMNNTFYRLGYEFTGRLLNHCDIYGAYEDMNIWVKRLQ